MGKIHVLLIGPLPIQGDVIGGTKISFAKLVQHFSESPDFAIEVINISRRLAGASRLFRGLLNALALVLVCWHVFRLAGRHDVVLLNVSSGGALTGGPLIWFAAKLRGRPVITRLFGGDLADAYDDCPRWRRWLADKTFLRGDLLLLQTHPLCERFGDRTNVRWFPTTRDLRSAKPLSRSRCQRFLFLSQIRLDKGIMEALEAAESLPAGCSLTVHGAPVLGMDVSCFAGFRRSHYRGELAPHLILETLCDHDVLLFPSYCATEGMPGVIIEALQCGLPVVAADWRFASEIIQDGMGGILVSPRSAAELSRAMNKLADDADLFRRLSVGARARGDEFRSSKWHAQLESWIRDLCPVAESPLSTRQMKEAA